MRQILLTAEELVDLVAHRVNAAVDDCFAAEYSDGVDHGDLFWRASALFSGYEDVDLSQIRTKEVQFKHIKELSKEAGEVGEESGAARWRLAIGYVDAMYTWNLRFVGKEALEESMPKVLLPVAEFMKAATV